MNKVLNFLREYRETHQATSARRAIGWACGLAVLAAFILAVLSIIPVWVFLVVVAFELAGDIVLTRTWLLQDANS